MTPGSDAKQGFSGVAAGVYDLRTELRSAASDQPWRPPVRIILSTILICAWVCGAGSASDIVRDAAGSAGLRLGACVSGLGDQDGDGDTELLVGAPGDDTAGQDAGRVYLWFGGVAISLNANQFWAGETGGEQFGHCVASIGDVDDDGVDDFAVGAPYSNATSAEGGRVYVFFGGPDLPAEADLVLESPAVGGRFGWSIAAVGDLDGDGIDDLAVGAPWADTAGVEAGAAYVYLGAGGGPATTPDLTLNGILAYDRFGWSVAGVGEFLGSGARCLAVGAPSNGAGAGARQGAVHVFEGSTSPNPGPDTDADLVLQSSAAATGDNEFGYSVAAIGSFDGDLDPDLAVGAPYSNEGGLQRGRVEIFLGGVDADENGDFHCAGPAPGSRLGWSVAGVGDVLGSGLPDVLMGAPYDDVGGSDAGRAFLWPGGSGDVADADLLDEAPREGLVDAPAGDHFGTWCAGIGDIDGDGGDDYAVGAPDGNVESSAVAGWVRFVDSSGEATPLELTSWSVAWTDEGAAVGSVLAGSLDRDRIASVRLERQDAGGSDLIHDGPLDAARVDLVGGRLTIRDPSAAWQTRGAVRYRLALDLVDGQGLATGFAAVTGPRPETAPQLAAPAPNPTNPATTIRWRAMAGAPVSVTVHDVRGRLVHRLHDGAATGDWQAATWRGGDDRGRPVAAGVYLVRLSAGTTMQTRRLLLVP
ncbi:T9SS type A sorting domain-containing protein [bacterium]|nr:T9SS type A sorting domain-containing protein [bacterium]